MPLKGLVYECAFCKKVIAFQILSLSKETQEEEVKIETIPDICEECKHKVLDPPFI